MKIALDATYSVGRNLSGVAVYSREVLYGLAKAHPESDFLYCYRPHRFLRSFREQIAKNAHRRLLIDGLSGSFDLFHGLNQRIDSSRYKLTVSTFHDLFVLSGEYSTADFRQRFAQQAREAAERSDRIIAVSSFTAGQVRELLKFDPSRIRVVPHGVRRTARFPDGTRRERMILFVGAIQKRKNVARLVEAFAAAPVGWKLVLAGSFGYGAQEALDRIEASPRRADIQVRGYISDAVLEDLYARASVFAFPSLDEGFGMPVLDAMAQGVPVLTSNASALPEVAGDAALLVDPSDVASIAGGMRRLTDDEALRAQLAQAGLKRSEQFSWEKAVKATWSVYRELLD